MSRQDTPPTIEILQADLDDTEHADAVLSLVDSFAIEPVSGGTGLAREVLDALIPGLRAHPTTLIFLARQNSAYLGAAICFLGFSTFFARPLVNIHDLTVLAEHRGKGIGRLLLSAVESKARELGSCKLTLEVRTDNEGARRLYASEGFTNNKGSEKPVSYFFLEKHL